VNPKSYQINSIKSLLIKIFPTTPWGNYMWPTSY
jgi:hypothetical protein